jgi:hypothetical protein
MESVYELIIVTEEYEEKEVEMLFPTPQAAYEQAVKWNDAGESRPALPPLNEWKVGTHWHDGIQLILQDWADVYRVVIVQRKIHGATA